MALMISSLVNAVMGEPPTLKTYLGSILKDMNLRCEKCDRPIPEILIRESFTLSRGLTAEFRCHGETQAFSFSGETLADRESCYSALNRLKEQKWFAKENPPTQIVADMKAIVERELRRKLSPIDYVYDAEDWKKLRRAELAARRAVFSLPEPQPAPKPRTVKLLSDMPDDRPIVFED